MDISELEYMKSNEEHLNDFCLSTPQVLKIEKIYEDATDQAKKLAEENKEAHDSIETELSKNQEVHYEFSEKQEELKKLLNEYNKKRANFDKQEIVKVVQAKASGLNKESAKIQKEFKKGEISNKDFLENYGSLRREYHQIQFQKDAILAM
jgi:pyruvate/2-oxoglutarate dehydrogenase complex dihydrolipoamide dehydrogenase (E3) component